MEDSFYVTAGRTRIAGSSMVVTIPAKVVRTMDLQMGDLMEIRLRKIGEGWSKE